MVKIILIVIALLFIGFLILAKIARAKMKNAPLVDDHQNILTLTDKNFQLKTKDKLVLVDFWASWCGPCRIMAPILNDLSDSLSGKNYIGKVDVEKFQGLAQKFKVQSIPTLILFKNGKEINRFVGIKSKDFLLKEMAKVG